MRGRKSAIGKMICAGSTGTRRKNGGILRRTGKPSQGGQYRGQQAGFERRLALDAFLSGDFLQHRFGAFCPVPRIGDEDQRHQCLFSPLQGGCFGQRRQLPRGAQRCQHLLAGWFLRPRPPNLMQPILLRLDRVKLPVADLPAHIVEPVYQRVEILDHRRVGPEPGALARISRVFCPQLKPFGKLLKPASVVRVPVNEHRPSVHRTCRRLDVFWKFIGQLIQFFDPLINIPGERIRKTAGFHRTIFATAIFREIPLPPPDHVRRFPAVAHSHPTEDFAQQIPALSELGSPLDEMKMITQNQRQGKIKLFKDVF